MAVKFGSLTSAPLNQRMSQSPCLPTIISEPQAMVPIALWIWGVWSQTILKCASHTESSSVENDKTTGKAFHTLTAIPAPFCCTWLKDRYEVTTKFTGQRGSLSLQNSRSTLCKLLPQVCNVTRKERCSKMLQPLDSRRLHSSPTSPRAAEGSLWVSTSSAQGPTRHWGQ